MGQRLALIIGNGEYEDPTLAQLKKSNADVNSLAEVLRSPQIGGFDQVTTLINQPHSVVRREIARFFTDKRRDDLLLLYFSGHGVKDDRGRLYLAVKDTEHNFLSATAVSAVSIADEMDDSRSQRLVLILDCCHSGAFAQGTKGVTQESVGTGEAFRGNGYGRVVLSATDSTQYAWEGDQVIGEAENSVYTHYLIQGLRTGEADANSDSEITVDELHDYVYEQVVQSNPKQTPRKSSHNEQRDIVIARNLNVRPAELSSELRHAIENEFPLVRERAVNELTKLLQSSHRGLALAAQQALERIAEHDDSRRISNLARETLQAYYEGMLSAQQPAPDEPEVERDLVSQGAKAAQPVRAVEPTPVAGEPQAQIQEEKTQGEEQKQELLRSLYEMGSRAIETRDWKRSINAFELVLGIDPEYRAADRLLKLAREEQRKTEATAEDTPQSPIINASRSVANTSGQGKDAIIPEEIKKWNWGAFLLNGIWGPANGVYIALLSFIPFLISPFLVLLIDPIYLYLYLFIPITLPMSLILGIRGNKWAWQNKRWESVEHFQKTQQEWTQLKIIIPAAAFWLFMFSSPYLL